VNVVHEPVETDYNDNCNKEENPIRGGSVDLNLRMKSRHKFAPLTSITSTVIEFVKPNWLKNDGEAQLLSTVNAQENDRRTLSEPRQPIVVEYSRPNRVPFRIMREND
jgi:hypothetical protein